MHEFAKRLKAARIEAGYESGAAFARAFGVDKHRYRHWEAGRRSPDLTSFHGLCKKLGKQPNDLLPLHQKMLAA